MAEAIADAGAVPRTGRYRWLIVAVLFAATTVNYIDRTMLGLLALDDGFVHVGQSATPHLVATLTTPNGIVILD